VPAERNQIAPPSGLAPASQRLWRALVNDVECVTDGPPAAASLVVVEEVIRARERLAEVRKTLADEGVTVSGSRGQLRPHPLLVMERQLVGEIVNGLERLELRPSKIRGMRQFSQARDLTRG
jgi:hypothetical protein